jgi:uncharacterized protein
MKKTLSSLLFITIFSCLSYSAEVKFPDYSGNVNDYAGIIDTENTAKIKILANQLKENTGAEIAIVTIRSAYPLDSKSYATQLFEKWGIGKKDKDNGLLILFIKKDRRIEVEVGYGLEGIITDGFAGEVLDKYAVPQFKEGNLGRGLYLTTLAFYDRITKQYSSAPQSKLEQINMNIYSVLLAISVIIFVVVLAFLGSTLIGTIISGIIGAVIGYFIAGLIGIFFGFLFGIFMSKGGYYGGFGGSGGMGGGFGGGRSGGGGAGRSF